MADRVAHLSKGDPTTRLKDKVALITGAGSGQGRATALLFAAAGADVYASDVNEQGLQETAARAVTRASPSPRGGPMHRRTTRLPPGSTVP